MSAAVATAVASGPRLNATGIVRSEWIKLRSLRSTVWAYAVVILVSIGLAGLMSATLDLQASDGLPADVQVQLLTQASTFGIFFGQLVVAVLGVLVISGEYSTGMIRSTLATVPRRLPALWAKAAALFVATLVVGVVSSLAAFFVASPILAAKGVQADLIGDGVLWSLLGGAVYLALIAVFALGIGAILRNGAGGIATALGLILLLPIVLQMIPADWARDAQPYLLSVAGAELFTPAGLRATGLGQAALIVVAWAAASLAGAAVLLKRRDA